MRSSNDQAARLRLKLVLRYLLVAGFCAIVAGAVVGERGLVAMLKVRETQRQLEKSLARTREANARLRVEAQRLRDNPSAIEEIARRELGLVRLGERLFIIRDIQNPNIAGRNEHRRR